MAQLAAKSEKLANFRRQKKRFRRAEATADIEGLSRNDEWGDAEILDDDRRARWRPD